MRRAQASITAAEAAVGVILVMSLAFTFALGTPGDRTTQRQLDLYADDAVTLLATEQPRHADQTRLAELTRSQAAFERESGALEQRVERILPPNVLFQVETAYGTVGQPLPDGVTTGTRTVPTTNGEVTLRVWYA